MSIFHHDPWENLQPEEIPEYDAWLRAMGATYDQPDQGWLTAFDYDYGYDYDYDDCVCLPCEDFPFGTDTVMAGSHSDGPKNTTYTTANLNRSNLMLCCDIGGDYPGESPAVDQWVFGVNQCGDAIMGFDCTSHDIPVGVTVDHAHLRILSYSDQDTTANNDSDGTCYIAATDTPGFAANKATAPHTINRCMWEDVPIFSNSTHYETSNIAPAIQDVIDNPEWTGNFTLVLVPDLGFSGYQARWIQSAELQVWYHTDHLIDPEGGLLFGSSVSEIASYNPDTSGGLTFGGGAIVQTSYTPEVSGGLTFGGTILIDDGSEIVETPEGGILFGGHALVVASSDSIRTPSGGLVWGGSVQTYANGYLYRQMVVVPAGSVLVDLDRHHLGCQLELVGPVRVETEMGQIVSSQVVYQSGGVAWVYISAPLVSSADNVFYVYWGVS